MPNVCNELMADYKKTIINLNLNKCVSKTIHMGGGQLKLCWKVDEIVSGISDETKPGCAP